MKKTFKTILDILLKLIIITPKILLLICILLPTIIEFIFSIFMLLLFLIPFVIICLALGPFGIFILVAVIMSVIGIFFEMFSDN